MKYEVTIGTNMTPEEVNEALAELIEMEKEVDAAHRMNWTAEHVTKSYTQEYWALDRADLDRQLQEMLVTPDLVLDVKVLVDDSAEVMKDALLLEIANTEPTSAHYDWTSENVVSFGRKIIEAYLKQQAGK